MFFYFYFRDSRHSLDFLPSVPNVSLLHYYTVGTIVVKSPVAPCLAHSSTAVPRQPLALAFSLFLSRFTVRIIGMTWRAGTKGYKAQVMCQLGNFQASKALLAWEAPVPGGTVV